MFSTFYLQMSLLTSSRNDDNQESNTIIVKIIWVRFLQKAHVYEKPLFLQNKMNKQFSPKADLQKTCGAHLGLVKRVLSRVYFQECIVWAPNNPEDNVRTPY